MIGAAARRWVGTLAALCAVVLGAGDSCNPRDVVVMLDATSSKSVFNNQIRKRALRIVKTFNFGSSDSDDRVATFAFDAEPYDEYSFGNLTSQSDFNTAVNQMSWNNVDKQSNLIYSFDVAFEMLENNARSGADKFVVVISRGINIANSTTSEAYVAETCSKVGPGDGEVGIQTIEQCMVYLVEDAVDNNGVTVIYVPIDEEYETDGIEDYLGGLVTITETTNAAITALCLPVPTATCANATVDIMFVVQASSDVRDTYLALVHDFVAEFASRWTITGNRATRFAYMQYSTEVDEVYPFIDEETGYATFVGQSDFREAVWNYERNVSAQDANMPLALQTALDVVNRTVSTYENGTDRRALVIHIGTDNPSLDWANGQLPSTCDGYDKSSQYPKKAAQACTAVYAQAIQDKVTYTSVRIGDSADSSLYNDVDPEVDVYESSSYATLLAQVNEMVNDYCEEPTLDPVREDCLLLDLSYTGTTISSKEYYLADTSDDCQTMCQDESDCAYWSHMNKFGRCYMYSSITHVMYMHKESRGYVSGPKVCPCNRIDIGKYGGIQLNYETQQVSTWGTNVEGTLGLGRSDESLIEPVTSLPENYSAISISTRNTHSCLVDSSGSVYCWGSNINGQLGDGTTYDRNIPVQALGINNAVQVVVGDQHSCALLDSGKVKCWGSNARGQAGQDDITKDYNIPQNVDDISKVMSIYAAGEVTCGLLRTRKLMCWGTNENLQLGIGSNLYLYSYTPIEAEGLGRVRSVFMSSTHTCALKLRGKTYCWGDNNYSEVTNNGDTSDVGTPRTVGVFAKNVASLILGNGKTCAILSNGRVVCTGLTPEYYHLLPIEEIGYTALPSYSEATSTFCIGTGSSSVSNVTTTCFGSNSYGQFGLGAASADNLFNQTHVIPALSCSASIGSSDDSDDDGSDNSGDGSDAGGDDGDSDDDGSGSSGPGDI